MSLHPIAPRTSALPAANNCSAKSPKTAFHTSRTPRRTTCRLAAHYALRAAAQHVLLGSRFIKVPLVGGEPGAGRIQSFLIQWTDSIADIEVVHVPVDFLAETADGQLIVEIAIPGLPATAPLDRVERSRFRRWLSPFRTLPASMDGLTYGSAYFTQLRTRVGLSLLRRLSNARLHCHPGVARPVTPGAADKASSSWTSLSFLPTMLSTDS